VVGERVHGDGLPFTGLTAALAAQGFGGDETGVTVQPAAEPDFAGKTFGEAREVNEDGLGDVLGEVGVAADEADGGGIDEIEVAGGEFAKGGFRAVVGVIREQFLGVRHLYLLLKTRRGVKTDKKFGKKKQRQIELATDETRMGERFLTGRTDNKGRRKILTTDGHR